MNLRSTNLSLKPGVYELKCPIISLSKNLHYIRKLSCFPQPKYAIVIIDTMRARSTLQKVIWHLSILLLCVALALQYKLNANIKIKMVGKLHRKILTISKLSDEFIIDWGLYASSKLIDNAVNVDLCLLWNLSPQFINRPFHYVYSTIEIVVRKSNIEACSFGNQHGSHQRICKTRIPYFLHLLVFRKDGTCGPSRFVSIVSRLRSEAIRPGAKQDCIFLANLAVRERKVTMGAGEGLLGLSDGRVIWLHRRFTAVAEKINVSCYGNTHNRERVREVKVPYC